MALPRLLQLSHFPSFVFFLLPASRPPSSPAGCGSSDSTSRYLLNAGPLLASTPSRQPLRVSTPLFPTSKRIAASSWQTLVRGISAQGRWLQAASPGPLPLHHPRSDPSFKTNPRYSNPRSPAVYHPTARPCCPSLFLRRRLTSGACLPPKPSGLCAGVGAQLVHRNTQTGSRVTIEPTASRHRIAALPPISSSSRPVSSLGTPPPSTRTPTSLAAPEIEDQQEGTFFSPKRGPWIFT